MPVPKGSVLEGRLEGDKGTKKPPTAGPSVSATTRQTPRPSSRAGASDVEGVAITPAEKAPRKKNRPTVGELASLEARTTCRPTPEHVPNAELPHSSSAPLAEDQDELHRPPSPSALQPSGDMASTDSMGPAVLDFTHLSVGSEPYLPPAAGLAPLASLETSLTSRAQASFLVCLQSEADR